MSIAEEIIKAGVELAPSLIKLAVAAVGPDRVQAILDAEKAAIRAAVDAEENAKFPPGTP